MNTQAGISIDIEKEKKKNLKLAVGVGALGVAGFMLLYALMAALMFLKPGLIFSVMPVPPLSRDMAIFNDTMYLISREFDFEDFSFEPDQKPKEKYLLSVLDRNRLSVVQEIEPYHSLVPANNRLYFLNDGLYRVFDGKTWTEARTDEIGTNPKGASNPHGFFALSLIEKQPALRFLGGNVSADIPLPDEHSENLKDNFCSSRLLWHQGRLILYWTDTDSLYWTSFDGASWSPVAVSDSAGTVRAVADDRRIYLFNEYRSGQERVLEVSYFENGSWSNRKRLEIKSLYLDWSADMHHGKPLLSVQNLFSDDLYTIEEGNVVDLVRIGKSWFDRRRIGKALIFVVAGNLLFFLFVFLLSVLIGRYKLRIWKAGEREYEFASLFRRFSAKFIDALIIMIPAAIPSFYLFRGESIWSNPFELFAFIVLISVSVLLGGFLYHSLLEGLVGKTLGKKVCGIVVLKDDFSKCGLMAGFLRNVMRMIDSFFGNLVGVVAMAGTLRWQRLGDIVAGTVVVKEKKGG